MLHCGFYEVEITPAIGSGMPGYFSDRRTTTIRDPLYAKAFAAKSQGEPIVLVILDALMVEKEDADHIRQGIAAATGISPANVAVGAIHSHTGGPVISLYNSNRDPEYCKFMIRRAINAGIMAFQRMEPARLAVDSRNVEGIAFCRRFLMADGSYKTNPVMLSPDIISPADVVDPQLVTVRVDRTDGTPMGIIANFALHTDTVNKGVYGFSADYPGQIREKVHEKYGNHVHFLFLQGTSGNVNHIDVTKSSEQQIGYRELAQILFAEISDMVDHMKTEDVETVSCVSCVREGYTRRPTQAECDASAAINPKLLKEMLPVLGLPSEREEFEIWTAAIGDLAINMLPGELFARFGLDIKQQGGWKYTMNSELSNLSLGYIYTREAQKQGGYESTPSTYVRMNSDTGYTIVEGAVSNMQKLK